MTKVFLSAGHGGSDPGACAHGLKEEDINLQTMLACRDILKAHGVEVVCSRTKDENDPVWQEVKEANASKANIAVSFHANAGRGDGFEAFYYSGDKCGLRLARLGEKHVKALGQNSRGCKTGNHLCFVRDTNMTAVLFESFFVDNDKDNDIGDTIAEQKSFGVAYAKAILEYLGITYKSEVNYGEGVTQVRVICPGSAHLYCDAPIYDRDWKNVVVEGKKGDHITVLDHGTGAVLVRHNSTEGIMHCKYVMPDIEPNDVLELVEDVTVTFPKGTRVTSLDHGYLGNKVAANFVLDARKAQKIEK